MCGIFFACSRTKHVDPDSATETALRARGPDSLKIHHVQNSSRKPDLPDSVNGNAGYFLTFVSSVLSLRGDRVCVQPLIDTATGSVLCWNGEAWRLGGVQVNNNDTEQIFKLLLDTSGYMPRTQSTAQDHACKIAEVLTRVAGPCTFVYYDSPASIVYYGRDRLGRRSLVINQSGSSALDFVISSFSFDSQPAIEVTTGCIHYLDLQASTPTIEQVPWPSRNPVINKVSPSHLQDSITIPSSDAVSLLIQQLCESIRIRVNDVPTYTASTEGPPENASRVAILFSGGLDCTLLARLAHDVLPVDQPIDLLNVAFENPRTVRAAAAQFTRSGLKPTTPVSPYETCPDRITARSSFVELINTCPSRTWRFVAIDVPYSDTLAHRPTVIKLMFPHNTEMDLSITLALYFASRGLGNAITSPSSKPTPYTTTSRVLLSGLGADELFGGYARHAAAFNRGGFAGLNSELDLDFSRIGTRNLGRDDRVMAHWGREVRYPYLDEDFVTFALGLPAWEKTGFRPGKPVPKHFEGPSSGGSVPVQREEDLDPAKMVLRLAAWRLGVKGAAGEKKRAIQFGARTAKMEASRTKGTDVLGAE